MKIHRTLIIAIVVTACLVSTSRADSGPPWVESAKKIHERFSGRRGTFAQFGDSLTYSVGNWYPLSYRHTNMTPAGQKALDNINAYMNRLCWYTWKGPKYGNQNGKNLIWACEHIDEWLKEMNPEAAVVLFGYDDFGQMPLDQYDQKLRDLVQKCSDNGTVVI